MSEENKSTEEKVEPNTLTSKSNDSKITINKSTYNNMLKGIVAVIAMAGTL